MGRPMLSPSNGSRPRCRCPAIRSCPARPSSGWCTAVDGGSILAVPLRCFAETQPARRSSPSPREDGPVPRLRTDTVLVLVIETKNPTKENPVTCMISTALVNACVNFPAGERMGTQAFCLTRKQASDLAVLLMEQVGNWECHTVVRPTWLRSCLGGGRRVTGKADSRGTADP